MNQDIRPYPFRKKGLMNGRSIAGLCAIVFLLVLVLASAPLALAATDELVLSAAYEPQGTCGDSQTLGSVELAQSFTAIAGGKLVSADALLSAGSNASGSVQAALYDITGAYGYDSVPTGEPLAVSDPMPAPSSAGWITFTFSGADLTLEAGANYALVLSYSQVMAGPEWCASFFSSTFYSGNMSYKESGGMWTAFWPGYNRDHYFRIHVTPATPPSPQPDQLAAELVGQYEEWIGLGDEGGLLGVAKTAKAAAGKAKALGNMLLEAQEYINEGQWEEALSQLESIRLLCDGAPAPADFVDGDAREDLYDAVEELIEAVVGAME